MPGLRSVVVVGAGLAGLYTARMLAARGVEVTVLEASERVGGRTWSTALGGATFDLGGQWIGSHHRRMHALANELGIATFPTHHEGAKVLVLGDQRSTYDRVLPTIAPHKLALLQLMAWQIDRLARELPEDDPWNAPGADVLDTTTVESWKRKMIPFADVRGLIDAAIRVIFGAEPAELSMLHFLYHVRQSGGLLPLLEVKGGIRETRFQSGAQSVCLALAEPLGGRIHLRSPVTRITQDDAGVTVFTDSGSHPADRVVVAVPPTIAGRIQYEPALPPRRDELMQRYPMGATLKCHILYDRAFWRREGLSGEAVLTRGPVSVVFDNTSHDGGQPALLAFAVGRGARELGALPLVERRQRVLDVLHRCFGPEALASTHYADKDWSADRWARGCPTGFMPPSVLTSFGPALRPPINRIHWAGTETARELTGYMEGALESAARVVEELAATD